MAAVNDIDIDVILRGEESQLTREREVERVLKAFKLNPYEILDLDVSSASSITENEIRKSYRKRSLLIHPDKLRDHPRGIEAFDMLKKAEGYLLDADKRKELDQTIKDARILVLRSLKVPDTSEDSHPKLVGLAPSLSERIRQKTKELMIEEELRIRKARKMTMIAEGTEQKRQEEAIAKRKRELEDKKKWEDTREARVTDWRSFQKGETSGKKKKKQKLEVLG